LFEQPVSVFHHKEIIHSFSINSLNPRILVLGTTSGVVELDLEHGGEPISVVREFPAGSTATSSSPLGHIHLPTIRLHKSADKSITKEGSKKINSSGNHHHEKTLAAPIRTSSHPTHHTHTRNPTVHCLSAHPQQPYYLSGTSNGAVVLWQYKVPSSVASYRAAGHPRVYRIKYNNTGSKFAACDYSGTVSLWRWSFHEESVNPYRTLKCHSGRCTDVEFLNLGSYFATSGHNPDKSDNVQFWDSLMPESKANIWSCLSVEGGASSLAYSPRHQVLFVGSKKGTISIIDIRQHQVLTTMEKCHSGNCRSLSIDSNFRYLVSGSTGGDIKLWDISKSIVEDSLPLLQNWEDVHKQQTFVRPLASGVVSTYGVTEVRVTDSGIYSCGSDGRLVFRPLRQ